MISTTEPIFDGFKPRKWLQILITFCQYSRMGRVSFSILGFSITRKATWLVFILYLLFFTFHSINTVDAQKEFLEGQLLVANPNMEDLRFAKTVIFICRHNSTGALGLVLNRSAGKIAISKVLDSLGISSLGIKGKIQIRIGGPLETDSGFLMYTDGVYSNNDICNGNGVTVSNDKDVLKTLGSENRPKELVLYFGYAGWGPQQLENELAREDWITVPADLSILFDPDIKGLWKRARAKHAVDL